GAQLRRPAPLQPRLRPLPRPPGGQGGDGRHRLRQRPLRPRNLAPHLNMFDPSSRYVKLDTATLVQPDGSVIVYVRRRFIPPADTHVELARVDVNPGERFDLLAARTLGDPLHFWRLCDANDVADPAELETPGLQVIVPLPQP